MTTPSMRLSELAQKWKSYTEFPAINEALNEAFSLGHEFGLWRVAEMIERRERDGFTTTARLIRALKAERVRPVETTSQGLVSDVS